VLETVGLSFLDRALVRAAGWPQLGALLLSSVCMGSTVPKHQPRGLCVARYSGTQSAAAAAVLGMSWPQTDSLVATSGHNAFAANPAAQGTNTTAPVQHRSICSSNLCALPSPSLLSPAQKWRGHPPTPQWGQLGCGPLQLLILQPMKLPYSVSDFSPAGYEHFREAWVDLRRPHRMLGSIHPPRST
jgi:hypothetical protein